MNQRFAVLPAAGLARRARWTLLPLLLLAAVVAAGFSAPASEAAKFGPKYKNCAKLKKKAAKKACKKRNAHYKKAFNAIKDSTFSGTYTDGTGIDATFCSNGKWAVRVAHFSGGESNFSGPRWKLASAYLTPNGKVLTAEAVGPSNNVFTRVGVQRRGKQWVLGRGNLKDKVPPATKVSARETCKTL